MVKMRWLGGRCLSAHLIFFKEPIMTEILHAPGFLGTNANFAADMPLVLSILVALIFTTGAWIAKKAQGIEKRYSKGSPERAAARRMFKQHRWIQTSGAVLNVIL